MTKSNFAKRIKELAATHELVELITDAKFAIYRDRKTNWCVTVGKRPRN